MCSNIIIHDVQEIISRIGNWGELRNKTVLITGPYGMLASYVMYTLIYLNEEKGFNIRIVAMARSEERFRARFGEYSNREYITVITESFNEPIRINGNVDYMIHAASLASPQYYDVCPVDVLSPNMLGTYYLLQLAVEKGIKGFLLFSSGDVYGKVIGTGCLTEKDMGILDPLDVHSCYGESKRMAETICCSYLRQYGVPVKILRFFHTYAPTMDIDRDPRVFASFMKNILLGQDIEIKSDGSGKRAFCYITDAVAGLFTVLFKGKEGEAYNICNTEQFVSIRDLALILAGIRKDVKINVSWKQRSPEEHYTENPETGTRAPGNEKLKSLGWEAKVDIREGFSRVYRYLVSE